MHSSQRQHGAKQSWSSFIFVEMLTPLTSRRRSAVQEWMKKSGCFCKRSPATVTSCCMSLSALPVLEQCFLNMTGLCCLSRHVMPHAHALMFTTITGALAQLTSFTADSRGLRMNVTLINPPVQICFCAYHPKISLLSDCKLFVLSKT